jgi:hypothetical protein
MSVYPECLECVFTCLLFSRYMGWAQFVLDMLCDSTLYLVAQAKTRLHRVKGVWSYFE